MQAVTPLRKAVAADPDNRNARGMLADALVEIGRFAEASEQYRKLTDLSPDDPRAWYGLGKSYEAIAANAFERLQKANPQSPYVAALVAGIGVAGVGIGLAMQGVLGNLVAGLTIIFTKPFRIGDYVELAGVGLHATPRTAGRRRHVEKR